MSENSSIITLSDMETELQTAAEQLRELPMVADHIPQLHAELCEALRQRHEQSGDVETESDFKPYCMALSRAMGRVLRTHVEDEPQRKQILVFLKQVAASIRQKLSTALPDNMETAEEKRDRVQEQLNRARAQLDLPPQEVPVERLETPKPPDPDEFLGAMPIAEKEAMSAMVNEFGLRSALLGQLFKVIYPRYFRGDRRDADLIKRHIGECDKGGGGGGINVLPPDVMMHPRVAWFRAIFFNAMRDRYLNQAVECGEFQPVLDELADQVELVNLQEEESLRPYPLEQHGEGEALRLRQQAAIQRRFLSATIRFITECRDFEPPSLLKQNLKEGRSFPDARQVGATVDALITGRQFNGLNTGRGKTGCGITEAECLLERGDVQRVVVLCPSHLVNQWTVNFSDNEEEGYYQDGAIENISDGSQNVAPRQVAVINGKPDERPEQIDAAQNAHIVVMGIEMGPKQTTIGNVTKPNSEWLQEMGFQMVILDEAQKIKNENKKKAHTRMHQGIMQTPGLRVVIGQSATPITNNDNDLVLRIQEMNTNTEGNGSPQPLDLFEQYVAEASTPEDEALLEPLLSHQTGNDDPLDSINYQNIDSIAAALRASPGVVPMSFTPFLYRPDAQEPRVEGISVERQVIPHGYNATERAAFRHISRDEGNQLRKCQRFMQVGMFPNAVEEVPGTGTSKIQAVMERADAAIEQGHTHLLLTSPHFAVGFTQPLPDMPGRSWLEQFREHYEPRGFLVEALDGDISDYKLRKSVCDASGRPTCKTDELIASCGNADRCILLAQEQTVNYGLNNLVKFSYTGRVHPDYVPGTGHQLEGRTLRPGQEHETVVIDHFCGEGLESDVYTVACGKEEAAEDRLSGLNLTDEQRQLLESNGDQDLRQSPHVSWHTLTPKQQLMFLLGQMTGWGADEIADYMEKHPQIAELIAELYNLNWDESRNGAMLRAIVAITMHLIEEEGIEGTPQNPIKVVDVASALGMERLLHGQPRFRVLSSDINPVWERVCGEVIGGDYDPSQAVTCPMHQLPRDGDYQDGSATFFVNSLAYSYAEPRSEEQQGVFLEAHRMLQPGGFFFLTFTGNDIRRNRNKYQQLQQTAPYFGFEFVSAVSGSVFAKATLPDEDDFDEYIFVFRKILPEPMIQADARWDDLPDIVQRALTFSRGTHQRGRGRGDMQNEPREHRMTQNEFELRGDGSSEAQRRTVQYQPTPQQEQRVRDLEELRSIVQQSTPEVAALLERYSSLSAVPDEEWIILEIDHIYPSPKQSDHRVRDAFAEAIIGLGGDIRQRIQEFNARSSQSSLVMKHEEGTGWFIAFADADGHPRGRKYPFNGDETADADANNV